MENKKEIQKIAEQISKIKNVKAVFLFGSYTTGKQNANSDIDLCVLGDLTEKEKGIVMSYSSEKIDISLFEELPIWIKTRVFRDGKSLVTKDKKGVMNIAFKTMHEWEDFKPLIQQKVYRRFGKCMT
jgi:uncharacterized protein